MKKYLFALFFCGSVFAQNIELGPVSIKTDTYSLSAIDWANAGQQPIAAFRQDIPKIGGGSEPFFIRPYPYGLSMEYAGLWEIMVEDFSVRYNFRYGHLLPKSYGNGPTFWVGDRLDSSALSIRKVGKLRVDQNNAYIIDPETGQPYLDDQAVEFTARTFRGLAQEGLDAGDMRHIVRGANRKFEWRRGPKMSEEMLMVADDNGLTVKGVNHSSKLQELEARIHALELLVAP